MKLNLALLFLTATASSVSAFQVLPTPSAVTSTSSQGLLSSSTRSNHYGISKTAFRMVASDSAESKPTLKRLEDSAVEISIHVPAKATQAAYDKVCNELSKNIELPGFRKGSRLPPAVLEQTMLAKGGKNAIKVQAINELMKQLVEPALKEQELDAIGKPALQVPAEELALQFTPGQELTLAVKCDVWPEIQWNTVEGQEKPYTGLEGKYTRKPFNQVKLNQALSDLKERYATLQPITDSDHALKTGDACVVTMKGFFGDADGNKGEPLPNAASGDSVEVILGPGRYMEGLVEGLEGAKVGQTVTVKVNFPDVRTLYMIDVIEGCDVM
jgi:trigger factor